MHGWGQDIEAANSSKGGWSSHFRHGLLSFGGSLFCPVDRRLALPHLGNHTAAADGIIRSHQWRKTQADLDHVDARLAFLMESPGKASAGRVVRHRAMAGSGKTLPGLTEPIFPIGHWPAVKRSVRQHADGIRAWLASGWLDSTLFPSPRSECDEEK